MRTLLSKLVIIFMMLGIPAWAAKPTFSVYHFVDLAGAVSTLTVQQPATGGKKVTFDSAVLYCENACVVTLERDGTAATTTAAVEVTLDETINTAPTATAFSTSNVGAGTTISVYRLSAGVTFTLDLSNIKMSGNGTTKNVSLRTASTTGEIARTVVWMEE